MIFKLFGQITTAKVQIKSLLQGISFESKLHEGDIKKYKGKVIIRMDAMRLILPITKNTNMSADWNLNSLRLRFSNVLQNSET